MEKTYSLPVLAVLTAAQLTMSIGAYAWGPLAPFFRQEFAVSRSQLGMLTSALYITASITAVPSGFFVDLMGVRKMLVLCLMIMGVSFAVMPLAGKFAIIIAFAAGSGIGYGIINQVSTKGIMYWFTFKTRATAMGVKQSGGAMGGAVAAILLPLLTVAYSWQSSVFVVGILILSTCVLSLFFYKEHPAEKQALQKSAGRKGKKRPLDVLSNPVLFVVILMVAFLAFSQICFSSFLVLYLNENLQISVSMAGTCLTVAMISGTAGRVIWGIISDRILNGNRAVSLILLSIFGIFTTSGIAFLPPAIPLWIYLVLSGSAGFALIGWNGVLVTYAAELAGAKLSGTVMGLVATSGFTGMVVGPPLFGYLADHTGYCAAWLTVAAAFLVSAIGFASIFAAKCKQ